MRISAATVADAVARRAGALESFMEIVVLKEALAVPVKHMDETGFRVNKDLRWLHVVCTPDLTHYRIGGRGDMLSSVSGVIVHDFYKSYYGLAGVEHALCGSHLLRELRALIDIENEPWATSQPLRGLAGAALAAKSGRPGTARPAPGAARRPSPFRRQAPGSGRIRSATTGGGRR